MVLLGICVGALLIGVLRLATDRAQLPVGSSYSAQPDGALGLYDWSSAIGGSPSRLQDSGLTETPVSGGLPTTLLVLQPETPLDPAAQDAFDDVTRRGGTLVVAGDSVAWLLYVRSLGVDAEPVRAGPAVVSTPDSALSMLVDYRFRLSADGAMPLLVAPNGDLVGLRVPHDGGWLVVLATPEPLTNAGLTDEQTARFVYREVLVPPAPGAVGAAPGAVAMAPGALTFDEAHHSFAPPSVGPATLNQLLFSTSGGGAIIYTALLVFAYVLLSGRRLGPPIPARPPTATRRTMYEHVQMLANLYRRAGQFSVVRAALGRTVSRRLSGGAGPPRRAAALADALVRIDSARTESALIAAVAAADDA
jgi:hypothetical protein